MTRYVLIYELPNGAAVMPSESKYEAHKVANLRLTTLARWILQNTNDGIDRGEIAAGFLGLERRYCGYFTDPCFSPNKKQEYERGYRRAQPSITKTLKRLETLGLVHLTRRHSHVKQINLTQKGKQIAAQLRDIGQ
jgi:hypothetical protein